MLTLFGKSGRPIEVSKLGGLQTDAAMMDMLTWVALTTGKAYSWTAVTADIDVADTLLAVRNDDPSDLLVIPFILLNGGNVASLITVHKVTAPYTAAGGAVVVGVPLGPSAPADPTTTRSDEEGNTQGAIIAQPTLLITTPLLLPVNIILAGGEALAADQVTESTSGGCTFFGYFLPKP